MKILHVITSVNPVGGGVIEAVKQWAAVLTELGHSVEIASLDSPQADWLGSAGQTVHALGPGTKGYGYSAKLTPWLRANRRNYDCVIIDGLWQYGSYGTWRALQGTDTPYFVFTHGMLDPWFKNTYKLKHFKKSLYWPWSEYRVLRDAKGAIFTCEEEKLLARQSFKPYTCKEVVVSLGTAAPTIEASAAKEIFLNEHPHLKGKRLLLFLSRIHPKKGCDLLIEAFANVAKYDSTLHLVMAGPDSVVLRPALERRARELNIEDRISWPGMLSGDMKWGAYFASEVFVLPSHQENFGIVVAEALSCGLPVLISNKVNIWREVEDSGAGIVANDDVAGTQILLTSWLSLSKQDQSAMSVRAAQAFLARFEIRHAAERFISVLSS
jgi:glycosyltransferase involved in cell wall biosynthesis